MKIRIMERKTEMEAGGLVPSGLIRPHTTVLACEDQEGYAGAAVLLEKGSSYTLLWLFVTPEKRRRGYGNALLKGAALWAKKQDADRLSVVYEAGCESGPVLDCMLSRQYFLLKLERTARVRITRQELTASALMKFPDMPLKGGHSITPLSHIGTLQLKQLIERCEKRGDSLVSQADYSQADARRSMVLLSGQEIRGMVLVHHEQEDGIVSIPLFFFEKEVVSESVGLLKNVAETLLEPAAGLKILEFSCMEPSVMKLADRFVAEKEIIWDEMVTGERLF